MKNFKAILIYFAHYSTYLVISFSLFALFLSIFVKIVFFQPYNTIEILKEDLTFKENVTSMTETVQNQFLLYMPSKIDEDISKTIISKFITDEFVFMIIKRFEVNIWDFVLEKNDDFSVLDISEEKIEFVSHVEKELTSYKAKKSLPENIVIEKIIAELENSLPEEYTLPKISEKREAILNLKYISKKFEQFFIKNLFILLLSFTVLFWIVKERTIRILTITSSFVFSGFLMVSFILFIRFINIKHGNGINVSSMLEKLNNLAQTYSFVSILFGIALALFFRKKKTKKNL